MASIIHIAYTFDSDRFHSELKSKVVVGNQLDIYRLQDLAKAYVKNHTGITDILSYMRYDEEWLEDPDGDGSQAYLWYTICLTTSFRPAPSLNNNRFHGSHYVLERVLPLAGWNEDDIRALIHGKELSTLLNPQEHKLFVENLSLYGGCLSPNDIRAIRMHLEDNKTHFLPAAEHSIEVIEEYAGYNNIPPENILEMAYEDALEMLQTAIQREEALYLLWDY
jgi:hypothetical protein